MVPLFYKHPQFELTGSWDAEIGLAQLWFPHSLVNVISDLRWRKREQAVLKGLQDVALTATVELIPTCRDLQVLSGSSELPEKDALAIVSARIELPDDGYALESAPPSDFLYIDPVTGVAIIPAPNTLLHGDAAGPMVTCADVVANAYPLPLIGRA